MDQTTARRAGDDPMIGRIIADRYEITGLIKAGGMGRVYRAQQRALDRLVAIKCIHPHLLTSEGITSRFLREARSLSRLNHPNVVSIFDFGRTAPAAGDSLFLVMELLNGPDLATLFQRGEPLRLPRIASIIRQTLTALAEAHHVGITHRDVKPDNIVLEPRRGGGDLVKVIDFGIAHGGEHGTTEQGYALGTPHYMAPELLSNQPSGPSSDIYATGVVLFQLLAGQLPFDDLNPTVLLARHASTPRPDPRAMAPDRSVPGALAEVCMRAMAIDPADRFPTAEAFATAVVRAASSTRWSGPVSSAAPAPGSTDDEGLVVVSPMPRYRPPAESLCEAGESLLVGGAEVLAWAAESLADRHVNAIVLSGRAGTGRSRLLREISMQTLRQGALVVEALLAPPPQSEIGLGGLRELIARLVGAAPSLAEAVIGMAAADPAMSAALRAVWTDDAAGVGRGGLRAMAASALRWAAQRARDRAGGGTVLLVVDDVDRIDASSALVLADVIGGERLHYFVLLCSSEISPSWPSDRTRTRCLEGLSPSDASRLLGGVGGLGRAEGLIEPLYVEQLRRLRAHEPDAPAPPDLEAVIERHLLCLPSLERRVFQAIALTGGGPLDELAAVIDRPEELGAALRPLCDAGFIEVHQGAVCLTHAIFGRVALATAPAPAITALHGRVASALAEAGASVELRAHHAVRGPPGLGAFALLDEAARLRALREDHEGVIAACYEGIHAAESMAAIGDAGATLDSRVAFNQKLADALIELRRFHEAATTLTRALGLAEAQDARRAHLCERLALVAQHLRRPGEAERWRSEAREIEALGRKEAARSEAGATLERWTAVVLLVGVDPVTHRTIERALAQECALLVARGLDAAQQLAASRPPEVVLVDEAASDRPPEEIVRAIRTLAPQAMAIVLATSHDPGRLQSLAVLGPVLQLPLDPEQVRSAVRNLSRVAAMAASAERIRTGRHTTATQRRHPTTRRS